MTATQWMVAELTAAPSVAAQFTAAQYAEVGLIVFFGSIVQGTVGFAAGLFGIPLLLLAGLELPQAIMIVLIAGFGQNMLGSYKLWHAVEPRIALRPIVIRFAALPLGVGALYLLHGVGEQRIKQLVGLVLLAIVVLQLTLRVRPRARLHPAWEWVAFGASGFIAGMCAMGGPMIVLWVMAHDWPAERSRGFLFFVFAVTLVPQAVILWLVFGNQLVGAIELGLMGIVVMVAGTTLGLRIGHTLPRARLRRLTYILLVLVALSAILAPLV